MEEFYQASLEMITQEADGTSRPAVSWNGFGALESAPAVTGPWTEVTNAANPYVIQPGDGSARFYRLRQ